MKGYRGPIIFRVLVPQFGLGTAPGLAVKSRPAPGLSLSFTRLNAPYNIRAETITRALPLSRFVMDSLPWEAYDAYFWCPMVDRMAGPIMDPIIAYDGIETLRAKCARLAIE